VFHSKKKKKKKNLAVLASCSGLPFILIPADPVKYGSYKNLYFVTIHHIARLQFELLLLLLFFVFTALESVKTSTYVERVCYSVNSPLADAPNSGHTPYNCRDPMQSRLG